MVKITRRSVGAWGPARKCCGSEAPRKVHLHCAYKPAELRHAAERARNRALRIARDALSSGDPCLSFAEQPGSDSELEDNEEGQPCDDAETLAVIRGHHAKYSASVVPEGVSRELLKEFNKLEKAKQWFSLPEDVRQAINGEANAFVLFRYCHTGGQEAFSLHLKRDVREDEAIFAYTGKLYTKEAWEVKHPKPTDKTHLWAYDVPASEYGDGSGPDLVVAADEQRNESCYVQDFSWFSKTFPAEHNLYTKVYWTTTRAHPKQVLPYIVYCAEGNLCAGTELDVSWGDMCWQALSQHEVMKQAEFSWLESYRLLHLKAHVQAAKGSLPGPSNAPAAATSGGGSCGGSNGGGGGGKAAAGAGAVITFDRGLGYIESIVEAEEERNAAGAAAAHSRKRAKLPPPGVCYRRIGGKSASLLPLFPGFSTAVDDSALPASLRKAMDKCPKRKGVRVATEEEEELIASGELPGCVVAEVRGLHHSVRWATPPSHKAYTVLKATGPTINEGDPIGIYGGEMRVGSDTVDDPADEAYAMELSYKQLRR